MWPGSSSILMLARSFMPVMRPARETTELQIRFFYQLALVFVNFFKSEHAFFLTKFCNFIKENFIITFFKAFANATRVQDIQWR